MAAFSSAGQVRRRPVPVNTSRRRARSGIGVSSDIDMGRSSKPAPNFTPHAWLRVSPPTIQAWLEQFAQAYAQKPKPEGRAVVIELDEMGPYLKKSPSRSGSGKLGIVLQGGWWTGNVAVVTRPPASASPSA